MGDLIEEMQESQDFIKDVISLVSQQDFKSATKHADTINGLIRKFLELNGDVRSYLDYCQLVYKESLKLQERQDNLLKEWGSFNEKFNDCINIIVKTTPSKNQKKLQSVPKSFSNIYKFFKDNDEQIKMVINVLKDVVVLVAKFKSTKVDLESVQKKDE